MEINSQQVQSLGLSAAQLKALDKMDGKADGKISESIFLSAKTGIENNTYQASDVSAPTDDKSLFGKVKDFIFGKEETSPVKNTSATETTAQTQEAEKAEKAAEQEIKTKMQPFIEQAAAHLQKTGSLKGFSFKGFPQGVCNVKFSGNYGYEDESNDTYKIGNDGKGSVDRKPDSFTLVLTVEYQSPNGGTKTVTISKELPQIPKQKPDATGEWDIYQADK